MAMASCLVQISRSYVVVPWSACMHVFLCSVPSDDGYSEKALLHHAAALSILLD